MAGGHFKLYCSFGNHRKTLGAYRDDRTMAAYARLGMLAIDRYADRTEDEFLVSSLDLMRVFNVGTLKAALWRASRLADLTPVRVQRADDVAPDAYRVKWPNFAKKQFPRRADVQRERASPNKVTGSSASASASALKEKNPPRRKRGAAKGTEPKSSEPLGASEPLGQQAVRLFFEPSGSTEAKTAIRSAETRGRSRASRRRSAWRTSFFCCRSSSRSETTAMSRARATPERYSSTATRRV